MIILNVMSWQHFTQLQYIRNLPIHEQVKKYNYYLMEQQAMQVAVTAASAGGSGGARIVEENGGGSELVGIRALMTLTNDLFDSSSDSINLYGYKFAVENPITNELQVFGLEYLPSASEAQFNGGNSKTTVEWSPYHNKFIAFGEMPNCVGQQPWMSVNGKLWEPTNVLSEIGTEVDRNRYTISSNDGKLVYLTGDNTIQCIDIDGNSVTNAVILGGTGSFQCLTYSSNLDRYVAAGLTGTTATRFPIIYSDDAQTWYTGSYIDEPLVNGISTLPNINEVIWAPTQSLFIGGGRVSRNVDITNKNFIYYSSDGISWYTGSVTGGPSPFRAVTYHGDILDINGKLITTAVFTFAGFTYETRIVTSSNGIDWLVTDVFLPGAQGDAVYGNIINNKYTFGLTGLGVIGDNVKYTFTSSNGQNWGTGSVTGFSGTYPLSSQAKLAYSPTNGIYVASIQSTNDIKVSSDGVIFNQYDSDTLAVVQFQTSQSTEMYNTNLSPWYRVDGENYLFTTSSNSYRFVQFELYDDDTVPLGTQTYGTASYGIEISSASISNVSYTDIIGLEDVEIGGIRYIQEIDDPTLVARYAYYEFEPMTINYNFVEPYSFTVKSSGRRYVYFKYGIYGDTMAGSDYVGMKIDTVDGVITYYEDANVNSNGTFSVDPEFSGMIFTNPPSIVSSGSGYWTVSFDVSMKPLTYTTLKSFYF